MKILLSIRLACFSTLLVLPFAIGCGGGADPAPADDGDTPAAEGSDTAAATPPAGESAMTIVQQGTQTEAAESVAVFLDSLRRGDEKAANGGLTTKAREELAKTNYMIEPLGTPDGDYSIGRVVFPFEEKNVALVECVWKEPAAEGQPSVSMDIVCEVFQEAEGWRISGISLTIPGTDDLLVLDVEDAQGLQAALDDATGGNQQPPQQQQVATAPSAGGVQMQFTGAQQAVPTGASQQQYQPAQPQPYQPTQQQPVQQGMPTYSPQQPGQYVPPQQNTAQPQYQQSVPTGTTAAVQGTTQGTQLAMPPLPNAPVQR